MLSKERERLILECKICYMQPGHWVTILCGHMVCESCAGNLEMPKSCPICRIPFTGSVRCYPFAGYNMYAASDRSCDTTYVLGSFQADILISKF
ncbi:MAG: hypothetical protein LBE67_18840 [Kocuria palustris]|nr:hypothetical protein [Kocuria palustris]